MLMVPVISSYAGRGSVIAIIPPPPVVEWAPAPPAIGYIWQPGYWRWTGTRYAWIPGIYVRAPVPGAIWVPGYWQAHGGGWIWIGGYWRK